MRRFVLLVCAAWTVLASAASINLAWDPVVDARLGAYELGWGPMSGSRASSLVVPSTQTTATVDADAPFYAAVRARAADGDPALTSPWSNEVYRLPDVVPTQPVAQSGLWAVRGEAQVMADPVFGAVGTVVNGSSATVSSMTSTLTGVEAGDLVLAVVQREQMDSITGVTCAGNAMALVRSADSTNSGFATNLYAYRSPSAISSAAIVASFSKGAPWASMVSARWSNVPSATPLTSSCNATGCSGLTGPATTRTAQGITTTERALIIGVGTDYNNYNTHTAANGYTKRFDNAIAGGGSSSVQFIHSKVADAGSHGGTTNFSTAASDSYLSVIAAFPVAEDTGVSAALTGSASTASAGTIQALRSKSLSGLSATGSAGTIRALRTKGLSGASATGSAGSITLSRSVPLTGAFTTFSAGTLAALHSAGLTGQEAQALAGTVTPQIVEAVEVALTGASATSAAGVVGALRLAGLTGEAVGLSAGTIAALRSAGLSGDEINALAGTLSAQVTGAIEVALSGAEATTAAGTLAVLRSVVLTGDEAAMVDGIIAAVREAQISGASASSSAGTPVAARAAALSSSSASFSAGTLVALRVLGLTGAQINALAGTLSIPGVEPVIVSLTGVAFSALSGDLAASRSIDLAGITSAAQAGTPVASRSASISGASMTASDGILGALRAAALAGDQAQVLAGTLAASRSVGLTGAAVSTIAGTVFVPGLGWVQVTFYFNGVERIAYHDGVALSAWKYQEDA